MKRVSFIVVAAALLAACVALATSRASAEPIVGQDAIGDSSESAAPTPETADALARFQANDYAGALKLWRQAVRKDADLPPAQVIMAQLFFQVGKPEEAQAALEQAAVDAPDDPEAYAIMGSLAMRDRDLAKAESLYQKASSLLPAFDRSVKRKERMQPSLYGGLAGVAEARKDWAEAKKVLEKWLALDPQNTGVLQRIAHCLYQQKNTEGALQKLRECAKTDPDALIPEVILAQFCEQSGDRENARKWIAAALAAAPKDLRTHLAAAQLAIAAGQLDEGLKHVLVAMQIDPRSFEAKVLRGSIALFQKEYPAAEMYSESAIIQSPGNLAASNNLALALVEQNNDAKSRRALEYAEGNVRKRPKSADTLSTYGWVLYRLGRLDDAEQALCTAGSLRTPSVDTAYYTARVSVDRGDKAAARKLLETVLKSTGPSMFRKEAEELLAELKK